MLHLLTCKTRQFDPSRAECDIQRKTLLTVYRQHVKCSTLPDSSCLRVTWSRPATLTGFLFTPVKTFPLTLSPSSPGATLFMTASNICSSLHLTLHIQRWNERMEDTLVHTTDGRDGLYIVQRNWGLGNATGVATACLLGLKCGTGQLKWYSTQNCFQYQTLCRLKRFVVLFFMDNNSCGCYFPFPDSGNFSTDCILNIWGYIIN